MFNLKSISPSTCILHNLELYEPIHFDKLEKLLNSNLIQNTDDWNELKQLTKYSKLYNKKTKLSKVRYVRTDLIEFGRVNPDKALGLHMLRRQIRHTLADNLLIDIDIVNCHPVILLQICKKYNYTCEYLNKYVNDRETIINEFINIYQSNRDEIKTLLIRLINGGSYKKWLVENNYDIKHKFLTGFENEMRDISKEITENNPDLVQYLKKIKNKNKCSSVIAYYLQTIECYILEEVFNYCRKNGIIKNVGVLSNDGIMIEKEKYNPDLLIKFQNIIKGKFDLDLKFINKPFNEGYTDQQLNEGQIKDKIIEEYFMSFDLASHHFLAQKFMEINDNNNYKYNTSSGWYVYNEFNIIKSLGEKQPPLNLSNDITKLLQKDLKEMYKKMIDTFQPLTPKYNTFEKIYREYYKLLGSSTFKKNIIEELKIHFNDEDIENKIDSNQKLVAFNDMLFDFDLGIYRKINKEDYIMTTTGYNAPTFKNQKIRKELSQIIKSIFENDDVENFFLETVGFSLFTNKFEKLNMWNGTGGNGKGLLMVLLNLSFGDFFYIPDSKFLTSKYRAGQANPDLFNCKNKKIVMIAEPENDNDGDIRFNIEFLKRLTGRDEITTRDLHKSNITFKPTFTPFLQTNEPPKTDKMEPALSRRLVCVNFPFNFVENPKLKTHRKIDYELKDKLQLNFKKSKIPAVTIVAACIKAETGVGPSIASGSQI